jgi:hypothetical protein
LLAPLGEHEAERLIDVGGPADIGHAKGDDGQVIGHEHLHDWMTVWGAQLYF